MTHHYGIMRSRLKKALEQVLRRNLIHELHEVRRIAMRLHAGELRGSTSDLTKAF